MVCRQIMTLMVKQLMIRVKFRKFHVIKMVIHVNSNFQVKNLHTTVKRETQGN
jgi:hypothetical protein